MPPFRVLLPSLKPELPEERRGGKKEAQARMIDANGGCTFCCIGEGAYVAPR